jgi:DNA-binding transcriptional MerR regulator
MHPKDIPSKNHLLRTPLSKWRLPDLESEIDKRIAALFVHYEIAVSPGGEWLFIPVWSQQLAAALINEFEPWLQGVTLEWKLTVRILRRLDAFKGEAERTRTGAPVYKGHEIELLQLHSMLRELGLTLNEFSALAQHGTDNRRDLPKEAREVIDQFRKEIVKGKNPDFKEWFKKSRERQREEPDLVEQDLALSYGFLQRNIEQSLLSLADDSERQRAIACSVAQTRDERAPRTIRNTSAPASPLRTALVNYNFPKELKLEAPLLPRLPQPSEEEKALTEQALKKTQHTLAKYGLL